jgi:hypothetical protein
MVGPRNLGNPLDVTSAGTGERSKVGPGKMAMKAELASALHILRRGETYIFEVHESRRSPSDRRADCEPLCRRERMMLVGDHSA